MAGMASLGRLPLGHIRTIQWIWFGSTRREMVGRMSRLSATILVPAIAIFQGLAISLMAGEVASLFISRMAVPVLYFMANSPKSPGMKAAHEIGIRRETAAG
jgi:hypothetical protein